MIIIHEEDHKRDTIFTMQISNLYNYILYILIDRQELVKNCNICMLQTMLS